MKFMHKKIQRGSLTLGAFRKIVPFQRNSYTQTKSSTVLVVFASTGFYSSLDPFQLS